MYSHGSLWNKAPFVRLVFPFATGIVLQWQLDLSPGVLGGLLGIPAVIIFMHSLVSIRLKFMLAVVNGVAINCLLVAVGGFLVFINHPSNQSNGLGNSYNDSCYVIVRIEEPLVEKANSFKTVARSIRLRQNNHWVKAKGKLFLYFRKGMPVEKIRYGSELLIKKTLEEIRNSGNPGGFDYKRFCLFKGITHQAYLTPGDYQLLEQERPSWLNSFLFKSRLQVITTLKKYIPGKKEQGLAEAMLIGYKDDLDKDLVQAYSNTGVVHIIAISGLHLGLIYILLVFFTKPLNRKPLRWCRLLIIIVSLWLFSFLAGAQPSVLRSALMFTCLAAGEVLTRKASVYNTLALSAFILLCYNPFYLWDAGFQLSYAAVLSIVMFSRSIYNWFYFTNKSLDFLWKLSAVTIAAQILTLPISIYHFHQVPVLFLFTNLLAVPLGSIILVGEIILCSIWWCLPAATLSGNILSKLIGFMNAYIERFDSVSFAVWTNIYLSAAQAGILLVFMTAFCYWLMEKQKHVLWFSLVALFLLTCLCSLSENIADRQRKIIVYNISKKRAIDLINGRNYLFIGDDEAIKDKFSRNFHLLPSRVMHRLNTSHHESRDLNSFQFGEKHILLLDSTMPFNAQRTKPRLDLVVISRNPRLYIDQLSNNFAISQIVIDASVPQWKSRLWQRDCDSLGIPCHVITEKGAFVMNLR